MFVIMKSPSLLVDEAINFVLVVQFRSNQLVLAVDSCGGSQTIPLWLLLEPLKSDLFLASIGSCHTFFFGSIRNFPKQRPGTPQKKGRGSSPPHSVSVAEFMVLSQVTLGTRSGAAGDPNEKPQATYNIFTGLRRRYFTMVIQCINMVVSICKYDSFNYCIQTMNEQCRIEYCKIMKPWWYNGI